MARTSTVRLLRRNLCDSAFRTPPTARPPSSSSAARNSFLGMRTDEANESHHPSTAFPLPKPSVSRLSGAGRHRLPPASITCAYSWRSVNMRDPTASAELTTMTGGPSPTTARPFASPTGKPACATNTPRDSTASRRAA